MPLTDNQLHLIFRYFDGDLSIQEEAQLMQQLQQSEELQQAFDQQVLMHQFRPSELVEPIISTDIESADNFLKRVTGAMEAGQAPATVRPLPIVKRRKAWMAAAAILVCMLAISIYFINRTKKDNLVVKLPGKDSLAHAKQRVPAPFSNDTIPVLAENLQQLYNDNYVIFSGDGLDIPPPAMMYESDYKQRNYQKLATLPESTLGTKGTGDPAEDAQIANYFHFYKALAALQIGDTTTAEKLLKKLLNGSTGETELAIHAKWYLLMVYLKSSNKQAALDAAAMLTKGKRNTYYKRAVEIKEKLSS